MIDIKTSNRALGFLLWFRKYYGGETGKTYQQIAEDYRQSSYGAIRLYLLELLNNGYVRITNKGKRNQKFYVNEDKFKEIV